MRAPPQDANGQQCHRHLREASLNPKAYASPIKSRTRQAETSPHVRCIHYVHINVEHNLCHGGIRLAGAEGIEPPAVGFGNRCSTAELHPCRQLCE